MKTKEKTTYELELIARIGSLTVKIKSLDRQRAEAVEKLKQALKEAEEAGADYED